MQKLEPLNRDFFDKRVEEVAPALIGCQLYTTIDGKRVGGIITETEAYDQNDAAAHCYLDGAKPPSSEPMRFEGGHVYFYYTRFGRCLNFTCGADGFGSAVLVRMMHPTEGLEIMRARRRESYDAKILSDDSKYTQSLCNGPQNLCESLGLNDCLHKQSLSRLSACGPPFELFDRNDDIADRILIGKRIGIEKQLSKKPYPNEAKIVAIEKNWRWRLA